MSQVFLALDTASAGEASEADATADAVTHPSADSTPGPGTVYGLGALALMQRERSEQRGAPRMLPLLATRTEHGRLWLGLTRGRSETDGARDLRLEMVWVIPVGR